MYKYRRIIISVIALILIASLLSGFIVLAVNAKSSDEIQDEIDALEEQADELAEKQAALEEEIAALEGETISLVEQKTLLDNEMFLLREEIELVNQQLHQYNLLIAEKQAELDEVEAQQQQLFEHYKERMRVIQEQGTISYWEVFFEAESFADMLNSRIMLEEIARADQRMMDELRDISALVLEAKDALADEKANLELKKLEIAEAEELLEIKRIEAEEMIIEINAQAILLNEEAQQVEDDKNALLDDIAEKEAELTEALRAEWEAAHPPQPGGNNSGGNGGSGGNGSFLYPLPPGAVFTSPYGYRVHPVTGNYTLHNGVDLAIARGTPIYASKSGYITTAVYNYSWGNYVVINHMDGYSTLYGHMDSYIVTEGQYVEQGQVIGYVGTTGWSTGYHLHFTIFYNGSSVNPADYIPLP